MLAARFRPKSLLQLNRRLRAEQAAVDRRPQCVERLARADVARRLVATNVLFARLEGEHEGALAVGVERLADVRAKKTRTFEMHVPVYALDEDKLIQLKEILTASRGSVPARLTIVKPDLFRTTIALPEYLRVNPSDDLLARVEGLFGKDAIRLT